MWKNVFIALLVCMLTGCMAVLTQDRLYQNKNNEEKLCKILDEDGTTIIYSGTVADINNFIFGPFTCKGGEGCWGVVFLYPILLPIGLIDLPFSLAGDTVMLPYTIPFSLSVDCHKDNNIIPPKKAAQKIATTNGSSMQAALAQGFTGVGSFSNGFTKEHPFGTQVSLWRDGSRIFGLFSHSEGLITERQMGLLEKVTFDPVTRRITFNAKLTMGLHSCKVHNNEPSRDLFIFEGILSERTISGTLKRADGFHGDQDQTKENIVLKNTDEIVGQYQSREQWESVMKEILSFHERKW